MTAICFAENSIRHGRRLPLWLYTLELQMLD